MVSPSGDTTVVAPGTVGRDDELAHLAELMDLAGTGRPSVAVIGGEPGSGKTHLLHAFADHARSRGWTCLSVQGVESEAGLVGAGLLSVVSPLRAGLGSIPEPQAEALAAALGWGPVAESSDRFLIGAATLSLLAAQSASCPLLVTVDDAQWVDVESTHALTFAARRLGYDRVVVVLAHRSGTPVPVSLAGFDRINVAGLVPSQARAMLGSAFASGVVEKLVAETGGNPLALRECQRLLSRAQQAGAAPLPRALPVPGRLQEVYAAELGELSRGAWRAAVLAAASSDQQAAAVLAALVAEGFDPETCVAESADVLRLHGGLLTFRHPLLRSAAWKRATVTERSSAHATLAAVVLDRQAQVWHRAEATPGHDPALADELVVVADLDRARRGFAAASKAMERAARLTPDAGARSDRLAVATEDACVAGDSDRARRLAEEVLGGDAGPDARSRVLRVLGTLEWSYGTFARAREFYGQAADIATGRLLMRTLCDLLHTCHLLDDGAGMSVAAERAVAAADLTDPEQAMLAAYLPGAARVVEERPDLGAPLVLQAIALLEADPVLRDDPRHLMVALLCPRWLMDPSSAEPYADRRINRARESGALGVLAVGLSLFSAGLAWIGDHVRAYAYAGEAVELLESLDLTADPGSAYETAATQSACRGLHDDARRLLDQAKADVASNGFDPMPPHLARAVALCSSCRGDLSDVVEVLEDQIVRFDGVGDYLEPLGVAPLLVEAYLGLGRDQDAQHLTVRFGAAQAAQPYPHVAAMVARCEGLVATELDSACAAFERATAAHEAQPDRFEMARTRLLYGMRLRRGGRRVDAREQLEIARREFVSMDLTLWADRASQEIAGTGERLHTREASQEPLTSQETRVALLAAQGLTNREVAAALFLSPKTVEHHMGSVLRKRGLRSRTELARAMASDGSLSAGPDVL